MNQWQRDSLTRRRLFREFDGLHELQAGLPATAPSRAALDKRMEQVVERWEEMGETTGLRPCGCAIAAAKGKQ